ncbi:DMT family transporter [Cyanobium sp. WAJ14-Wanaka]|nr:DMT family transporter [Cyanobium sp. WAJ14-Wanaka]
MVASAFSFSLMSLCVKQVGTRIPAAEVVLARSLLSVVLSWWLLKRAAISPWGNRRGLLVWRGCVGTGALLCVYSALASLPLASATVLQYLYPTFTGVLAWVGLREHLSKRLVAAIAIGWLGVLIVAQPATLFGGSMPLPLIPVLVGICGALLTAIAYVSVRSLANTEHPLVVVFYFPLVALPMSIPLVWLDPVLPTPVELIWLVGVGLFTQIGQVYLTRGIMALPAARATAISYVQVIFAGLWGWIVFGETINRWTITGALLVMAATLISLSSPHRPANGELKPAGDR